MCARLPARNQPRAKIHTMYPRPFYCELVPSRVPSCGNRSGNRKLRLTAVSHRSQHELLSHKGQSWLNNTLYQGRKGIVLDRNYSAGDCPRRYAFVKDVSGGVGVSGACVTRNPGCTRC